MSVWNEALLRCGITDSFSGDSRSRYRDASAGISDSWAQPDKGTPPSACVWGNYRAALAGSTVLGLLVFTVPETCLIAVQGVNGYLKPVTSWPKAWLNCAADRQQRSAFHICLL